MPDVEIAVRLRGKPGDDAAAVLAGLQILRHDRANKIRRDREIGRGHPDNSS